MRTNYPVPSFSDQYKFQLVDSTFIHAVHLAKSKGSWTYSLGVSLQSDQDTIYWYIVKDPVGVYNRLTDPKKSPGFTYNNSVKGKQYTKQQVVDKPQWYAPAGLDRSNVVKPPFIQCDKPNSPSRIYPKPLSSYIDAPDTAKKAGPTNLSQELTELAAYWEKKAREEEKAPVPVSKGFASIVPPKPQVIQFESNYGPLLDTFQCNSTCINFLGLGYNRAGKGLVIYYALKTKPTDVIAIETDDAGLYREWTQSSSLGQYYNRHIKGMTSIKLRSRV